MRRSLLLLFLLLPAPALATTIVALPERDLIGRADTIVLASVVHTQSVVNPGGRVATRATLQVYQALRGANFGDLITMEVPGGKVGGLVAVTAGSPTLATGELVFGFLERSGELHRPLGLAYGLLRVQPDGRGGYRVWRDTDGLTMLLANGQPAPPSMFTLRDVALADLVTRVTARLTELGVQMPDPKLGALPGMVRP